MFKIIKNISVYYSSIIIVLTLLTGEIFAQGSYIFYVPTGDATKLYRANADGTDPHSIYTGGSTVGTIAVDAATSKIYFWVDATDIIYRTDYDGSGVEEFKTGIANMGAFAAGGGYLYYAYGNEVDDNKDWDLVKWNAAGTETTILDGATGYKGIIQEMAYDASNNYLYFFENDYVTGAAGDDRVAKISANGGAIVNVYTNCPIINGLSGANGYVYYSISGDKIYRTNNTHAEATTVYGSPASHVAIDVSISKLYYLTAANTIYQADLDGSNDQLRLSVAIQALGAGSAPAEIDIKGNNVSIGDGDTTPDAADHTDFGSALVAGGTVSRTFTIYNTGGETLSFDATPVSLSVSTDFTITDQPATTIAPGGSDTFTIQFDPSASGSRSTTVSINNNDSDENPYNFSIQGTGAINITVNDISANENAGSISFTISLTSAHSSDITVNYATANNTATTVDNDYTSTTGTATITATQTTTTVSVPITNDTHYEDNETFYLNLSNASFGTITDLQGVGTITNDDSQPSVMLGLSGSPFVENAGVATVTATLSNRSYENVTVNLGYTGTATGGGTDYTAAAESITINAESLTGSTTLTAVQDVLGEGNETVIVDITGVTNGTENGTQQVTATITDDDYSITVNDVAVNENAGNLTFTITISLAYTSDITIDYATANNTATTADNDYTSTSGTATITATQTTTTVSVPIANDTRDEDNETFYLNLSNASFGTITDAQGVGTINDDDDPPTVTLSVTGSPFAENGGTATVTATLSAVSGRNASIDLGFTGTATNISDYTRSNTSITINAGSTAGSITLTGANDATDEDNYETVIVDMTGGTYCTENGVQTVTANCDDDEDPEINLQGNSVTINNADVTPSAGDDTDFGYQAVLDGTTSKTFTIQNTGTGVLTLGAVSLSGGQSGDFSVTDQPASTIPIGGSDTFTIQFDPSAADTRATTVNINNDDENENPYTFAIQGTGIDITAPTTQASAVVYSSVHAAKLSLSWTRGDGNKCAVFMTQGSAGTAAPVKDVAYTANTVFGSVGSQIGATGWYCVYNDVGTSTTVTKVFPGTAYRVMVCEYNEDSGLIRYNTSSASGNPANQTTNTIMINEVDADTPGDDTGQFIELFSPGSGNVSLDGLVLVLFNGSDNQSYRNVDLDGYSTDEDGYFVYGNSPVSGVDLAVDNIALIQNGADAVALYVGDAAYFGIHPEITTDNLVDALVYDTGEADDAELLALLNGGQPQINEDGRGNKDNHSNQRIPNGTGGVRNTSTYTQQPPTPDAENYAYPEITSATYDYNTNLLVVTGNYFVSNAGAINDIDVSLLTFTGEGGGTYALLSTSDVEITSAAQFSVTLSGMDIPNVESLLNNNGLTSAPSGTTYNLAAADNWMTGSPAANDISDITGNGITVSNYADPVITSSTYDVSTGLLVATGTNFVVFSGAANDVDASLFTFTGQGGGTYILTNTSDVEITSATQFTLTLSSTDKLNVDGLLNKNGTQSAGGTTYNLAAADNWMTGSPAANNIADGTTGINVSNVPIPTITSAAYNYNTNVLVVTGTGFIPNAGALNDVDISKLIFTGEAGGTYPIASATNVEITSATEFSVTLSGTDLTNIEALLNKDGTSSAGGTTYNLAAAEDWLTGFDTAANIADLNGNGITVSNYASPTITSAAYDVSTGQLVVTCTNLVNKSGAANDIDASLLTIKGEGGNSYQLTDTPDADITSAVSFTLTFSATDRINVNGLLNRNGISSADGNSYNIAGADNWEAGAYTTYNIEDLTGNGITVSNVLTPTITNATYDSDSGIFVVTGTNLFKKYGATNDIDVSKFTVTGEGGTYTITSATDVEITSSTEFTFTVTGSDKTGVDAKLDLFGTQSSGGTTYNIAAEEDWLAAADPTANIADLVNNGITVMVTPKITSATYNAATGVIVVTGTNIQANGGGADIDAQKFTITGEGGETYTLINTPDVERASPTQFSLTLDVTDWDAIALIMNKNGTASTSGTTYNIAAADDWCTNVTSGNTADLTGNGITASNVPVPTITSAVYNASTGVFIVTGTGLVKKSDALNDIDISKFTVTGEGGESYNIVNTASVEITSGTQFTVVLDAADKNAVNLILNKNGASSTSGTTYNLAAAEDWAVGADAAVNVVDAAGNGITVSNVAVPVITSAYYHWSNGILTATGTGFTKKTGAANDIDASKLKFTGEGGMEYTLVGSADVEITSGTEFAITLDATDKAAVNLLLNKPGTQSNDNTVYNLAAAEDWAVGADAAVNVVDATTPITAGNFNNPPTGGDDVVNMSEDSPHTFAANDFTYNDADSDIFAGIRVETIETAGELKYNGADVTAGLDCPDVTKLVFTSPLNMDLSPYATFTFKVKDARAAYSIAAYTMTINVLPVNDAPVLSGIESTAINYSEGDSPVTISSSVTIADVDDVSMENASVQINGNYKDGEDVLSFTGQNGITGNWVPASGTITLSGSSSIANYQTALRSIKYNNSSANPDSSVRTISFTVNDGAANSNSVTRNVTINSTNNKPVLAEINDQATEEDLPLSINLSAADAEDDPIIFSAVSNISSIQMSVTETLLTITPNPNWNGESNITVIASDGKAADSTNFKLTVSPVNDAPVINPIADIQINEGGTAEITLEGSDIEGDSLLYSAQGDSSNVVLNITGNKLTIIPGDDWIGTSLITVTVSDSTLHTSTDFNLTVTPVNDAPVISPIADMHMNEGETKEIMLEGSDADGDSLAFNAQCDNNNIKLSIAGNKLTITSENDWAGTSVITVTVSDGVLNASTQFTVEVLPSNDAPVLSGIETDALMYLVKNSEIQITDALMIADIDDVNLESAGITISGNYKKDEDKLLFTAQNGITGTWDNESGVLTLTGITAITNYKTAISSIRYNNFSETPTSSTRTISFTVNDGKAVSNSVSREIIVSLLNTPSNLTLDLDDDWNVVLEWKDNSNNEDGFIIKKQNNLNGLFEVIDSVAANTTQYVDDEVIEGNSYTYVVLAFNNLGSVSDETSDNRKSIYIQLQPPTDLTAAADPIGKINLSWTDNSSVEENYIVERSEITNDNFSQISQVEKDSTHYSDTDIINNTKYYYRVYAVKDTLHSAFSNVVGIIAVISDVKEELTGIPKEYKLYANYPNPFNPATTIKFDLPRQGRYVLRIFNVIGQEVKILSDKEYSPGRYQVTFDASDFSSGIYFYQLIGNDKNFIKKMLLVK